MKTDKKPKLQVIMLVFLLSAFFLNGQIYDVRSLKKEPDTPGTIEKNKGDLITRNADIYLETTINPEEYIVGPGDQFTFNMLSSDGIVSLLLEISPTGDVLIPAVGVIFVDKLFLNAAIEEIRSKCLEKYRNAKINLTLIKIRKFKVQVFGTVHHPGFVVVSPITRVSDIYDLVVDQEIPDQNLIESDGDIKIVSRSDISTRDITLWRGSMPINVDLVKFNVYGNKELNPQIQQGDIIEFRLKKEKVGIYGGVELPGIYEYAEEESVSDIIKLAGGFTKNADTNKVEITRFLNYLDKESIVLNSNRDIRAMIVNPEDHIMVRFYQDYKRQDLVEIFGEVKYPGVYSIKVGETTFGDIIRRAGGYATKADSLRIIINNKMIRDIPDIELVRISLIPHEDRTDDEKSYVKARSRTKKGAIESHSEKYTRDIKSYLLNDNDEIEIPRYFEYVEILGAVTNPGRYPFMSSAGVSQYIKMAGGLTETATRKKYIIKASTGLKLPLSRKVDIENGDIIFIAEKMEYNTWNRIQEIMTTLGQIATIIIVIQSAIQ